MPQSYEIVSKNKLHCIKKVNLSHMVLLSLKRGFFSNIKKIKF